MDVEAKSLRFDLPDEAMVDVLRRLTPDQKLAQAHSMWRYARERLIATLRWQHPEWDEPAVQREAARRMLLGSS